ncbi:hypothetical protein A2W14_04005 [Candidatus Gottesmanbacteria bacterium RBG_16_37_8]|uniref:EamA domain-containing protein n=1 Tax=Candidatus Gottesmanbacteria bacterium RBG_16_37_8 TaxID=1798371 RepID=A0A1F5YUB4_9BACT|nr:MAG: hypothetical protein A2W14_04005 [Candidatus Gottesmanbacteria bacterium RBG_16_37_8]
MNLQMKAIVFSLISMIGFGLETAIVKKYSEILGPIRMIFYRNLVIVLITFIALLFFIKSINFDINYILLGFIISAASYGGIFFFMKALSKGKVGIVSPIVGTRGLIASFIGLVIFREVITTGQLFSILIAFTGIILSTINFSDFKKSNIFSFKSGVPFAILAAIFWGMTFPLFSIPSGILGAFLFSFILELTVLFMATMQTIIIKIPIDIKKDFSRYSFAIITIGSLGSLGSIFMNLGYATGQISIVSTILSCVPLVAVIYGRLVYRELMSTKQYLAAALMIAGIAGLSYFHR